MRTGNKRDGPFRPCRAGDGDANGLITVTRQRWTERISTRTCTPHDHTLPTNRTHLRNPGHRAEGAGRPARGQTPEGRHRRLGRRRHSLVTPSTCPLLTGAELGGREGQTKGGQGCGESVTTCPWNWTRGGGCTLLCLQPWGARPPPILPPAEFCL